MLQEGGKQRFQVQDLAPVLEPLLSALFSAFNKPDSAENEYVMRCIMRVIDFVGPEVSNMYTRCTGPSACMQMPSSSAVDLHIYTFCHCCLWGSIIKSLLVSVFCMQIAPAIPSCISALAGEQGILMRVIKNPTQPGFNHYLFESVAALVKQGCAKDPRMVDKLEEMLIPPFNYVLSQDVQVAQPHMHVMVDLLQMTSATCSAANGSYLHQNIAVLNVRSLSACPGRPKTCCCCKASLIDTQLPALQEFHPYVFQIFAQLIELHSGDLPAFYMSSLFQPLLAPVFWERAGNVPALTRLMQVCITGTT